MRSASDTYINAAMTWGFPPVEILDVRFGGTSADPVWSLIPVPPKNPKGDGGGVIAIFSARAAIKDLDLTNWESR